jgi:hypothetical protein
MGVMGVTDVGHHGHLVREGFLALGARVGPVLLVHRADVPGKVTLLPECSCAERAGVVLALLVHRAHMHQLVATGGECAGAMGALEVGTRVSRRQRSSATRFGSLGVRGVTMLVQGLRLGRHSRCKIYKLGCLYLSSIFMCYIYYIYYMNNIPPNIIPPNVMRPIVIPPNVVRPIVIPPNVICPIAVPIQKCRDCYKEFKPYPYNKYSAQYYRCMDCTGDKALIATFIHSCVIL